jgi:hypothetical protein
MSSGFQWRLMHERSQPLQARRKAGYSGPAPLRPPACCACPDQNKDSPERSRDVEHGWAAAPDVIDSVLHLVAGIHACALSVPGTELPSHVSKYEPKDHSAVGFLQQELCRCTAAAALVVSTTVVPDIRPLTRLQ